MRPRQHSSGGSRGDEATCTLRDYVRQRANLVRLSGQHIQRMQKALELRLGAAKAITATAHKLARIVYNLMRYGVAYVKQTEEQYAEQVRQRQEKQLHRRARELGFEVRKVEPPPAEAEPTAVP